MTHQNQPDLRFCTLGQI